MSKSVTLHLGEEMYEELREAAAAERRPLANLIELPLWRGSGRRSSSMTRKRQRFWATKRWSED